MSVVVMVMCREVGSMKELTPGRGAVSLQSVVAGCLVSVGIVVPLPASMIFLSESAAMSGRRWLRLSRGHPRRMEGPIGGWEGRRTERKGRRGWKGLVTRADGLGRVGAAPRPTNHCRPFSDPDPVPVPFFLGV